jgi:hypothetical protein
MARYVRNSGSIPVSPQIPEYVNDSNLSVHQLSIDSTSEYGDPKEGARGVIRKQNVFAAETVGFIHTKAFGRGHDISKVVEDTTPFLPGIII